MKIVGVVTIIYRFPAQLPTAGARNVWRKIKYTKWDKLKRDERRLLKKRKAPLL